MEISFCVYQGLEKHGVEDQALLAYELNKILTRKSNFHL